MILYRWCGAFSNFGDELNTLLWPALLPGFFDDNPAQRFLGIGSVLDRRHPAGVLKLVAGSGYGGYEPRARLDDGFRIAWVRGPRTAAEVGLPTRLGLGDPAMLVPATLGVTATASGPIGFMPHFESAARGAWQEAAAQAGIQLLDPREPPLKVLHGIAQCRLVLSEALHGVIVADALRIPWIALRPLVSVHRAKWQDWADTVGLTVRFHPLPASTAAEWVAARIPGQWHTMQREATRLRPALQRLRPRRMVDDAAAALRKACLAAPQLSPDPAYERCTDRMMDAVRRLQLAGTPAPAPAGGPACRSHLQAGNDSAYQLKNA
ncbi:MAG TPA: hypothetical protein VE690_22815 [Rhodopila sp.]|nr:hypothetical protein [Rhodopila sp.]